MINNRKTSELAKHFNTEHFLKDFDFIYIEAIECLDKNKLDSILTNRESYWMAQLFTLQPHGLNKRKEYKSKNRVRFSQ